MSSQVKLSLADRMLMDAELRLGRAPAPRPVVPFDELKVGMVVRGEMPWGEESGKVIGKSAREVVVLFDIQSPYTHYRGTMPRTISATDYGKVTEYGFATTEVLFRAG